MFLPLGDSPNPPGTPVVNYALIAINVIVFLVVTLPLSGVAADPNDPLLKEYLEVLAGRFGSGISARDLAASISQYDLVVFNHGFRPAEMSILALFSSMFLHGGFMHLAGNMLFLWIYGDNVEHRLGRVGYLAAYLLSGVAATAFHAAFDLSSNVPMVGASGAISGVLGFYFVFFPRNTVRVFIFMFLVPLPARVVLGAYLVLDNLLPFFAESSAGGGVAHGAHIGGFVAGLIGAWVIDRREVTATPADYRGPRPNDESSAQGSVRERVSGHVAAGQMKEAAEALFRGPDLRGDQPAARDALWIGRWLAEQGQANAALSVYRRVLRDHPSGPDAADAHLGAGLVQLQALGRPTSAYQHFLDAIDLDPNGDAGRVARDGLRAIESMTGRPGGRPSGRA